MAPLEKKRWTDAFVTAAVTAAVSLVMGFVVWYTVVERRMALLENNQQAIDAKVAEHDKAIDALMKDHVTKSDMRDLSEKLTAIDNRLTYIAGVLDGREGQRK